MSWTVDQMAAHAASFVEDGHFVDVGAGLAALVPRYLHAHCEIWLHLTESGGQMAMHSTDDMADASFITPDSEKYESLGPRTFYSQQSFAAMTSTTADVAVREAGDLGEVRQTVADVLASIQAKQIVVLVKRAGTRDGVWNVGEPDVPVRLITPTEILDFAQGGSKRPVVTL
ncbi:hypothetical protein [Cupriavidus necator]